MQRESYSEKAISKVWKRKKKETTKLGKILLQRKEKEKESRKLPDLRITRIRPSGYVWDEQKGRFMKPLVYHLPFLLYFQFISSIQTYYKIFRLILHHFNYVMTKFLTNPSLNLVAFLFLYMFYACETSIS